MGIEFVFRPEIAQLELTFEGNLDLAMTPVLMDALAYVDGDLKSCVINTRAVRREFDSGTALMGMLLDRLREHQVKIVMHGRLYDSDGGLEGLYATEGAG